MAPRPLLSTGSNQPSVMPVTVTRAVCCSDQLREFAVDLLQFSVQQQRVALISGAG